MAFVVLPHPFLITGAIAFALSFIFTYFLIPFLTRNGFVAVDLNKVPVGLSVEKIKQLKEKGAKGLKTAPRSGGIAIVLGFLIAGLLSLAYYPFKPEELVLFCAALLSVSLIAMIGIVEDFLHIRQLYRVLLPAVAALPLMVVSAGNTTMTLPLIGTIDFGVYYALLLIPLGVVAASNLVNLLAGFNGLEAGVGLIVSATLFTAAYLLNQSEAALLSIALGAACAAFLLFNWFPARIFPGNSATYTIGAAVAAIVILGNMERIGVIALAPQIAEFFLKATGMFKAENYGRVDKRGRLHYEGPTQSLSHLTMKIFKPTEQQLVLILLAVQLTFGVLALASIGL